MKKRIFGWLSLCLLCHSGAIHAQSVRLHVVDAIEQRPVPLVHIVTQTGRPLTFTGFDGNAAIADTLLRQAGDSIRFVSAFYMPHATAIRDIASATGKPARILLTPRVLQSDTIRVYGIPRADKLAENIARDFRKKWIANDYIAPGTIVQTVRCHDRYRSVAAAKGYFRSAGFRWKIKGLPVLSSHPWNRTWFCLDILRSDLFSSRSDDPLEILYTQPDGWLASFRQFSLTYDATPRNLDQLAISTLESLIRQSPLNPTTQPFYRYALDSIDDHSLVIRFATRIADFPDRVRLYGQGRIWYDRARRNVTRIELTDYLDYFRHFIRTEERLTPLHRSTVSLDFRLHENRLYPAQLLIKRQWSSARPTEGEPFYASGAPSRRSPQTAQLQELVWWELGDPLPIPVPAKWLPNAVNWYAPYTPVQWKTLPTVPETDWTIVRHDLERQESLERQAARNAFPDTEINRGWNGIASAKDTSLSDNDLCRQIYEATLQLSAHAQNR